jgi:hypothetical protein
MGTRLYEPASLKQAAEAIQYFEHMRALLETPLPLAGSEEGLAPRSLPLSPQAKQLFRRFHDATETQLATHGALVPVKAFASKAAEHAVRLVAVLALVEDLEAQEIAVDAMKRGIQLADYYLQEALRLVCLSSVDAQLTLAATLLERISNRLARGNPLKEKEISTISRISNIPIQHPHPDDVEERAAILEYDAGLSREAAEALARHGQVVGLPPCPHCKALGYRDQDGFLRCTATPAHSGVPAMSSGTRGEGPGSMIDPRSYHTVEGSYE